MSRHFRHSQRMISRCMAMAIDSMTMVEIDCLSSSGFPGS